MNRGHTLLEVLIAASLVGGVVLFASGTVGSLTDVGHQGQTKLEAASANQRALLAVANDLQSASSDTDPETGLPRYSLVTGGTVLGLRSKTVTPTGVDGGIEKIGSDISEVTLDSNLDTAEERFDAKILGTGLDHARDYEAAQNTNLTFRKVVGYTIDAGTGEVGPIWSEPISYSVNGRRQLIRTEEGQTRVMGRNVSLFDVRVDDLGNFIITLVTEQHDSRKGGVEQVANRIEVHPKNK